MGKTMVAPARSAESEALISGVKRSERQRKSKLFLPVFASQELIMARLVEGLKLQYYA